MGWGKLQGIHRSQGRMRKPFAMRAHVKRFAGPHHEAPCAHLAHARVCHHVDLSALRSVLLCLYNENALTCFKTLEYISTLILFQRKIKASLIRPSLTLNLQAPCAHALQRDALSACLV